MCYLNRFVGQAPHKEQAKRRQVDFSVELPVSGGQVYAKGWLEKYQNYLSAREFNRSKIADEVGVHKSTISQEPRQNKGKRGWRPKPAPNPSSSLYSYLGPTTSHEF